MQAVRALRKIGIEIACAIALVAPTAALAGGIKITVRLGDPARAAAIVSYRGSHLDYLNALPAAGAPAGAREAFSPSRHHLGLAAAAPAARVIAQGAAAIDHRTFVLDGRYFRLADAAPLALGTPESIAAREQLQALLDAGRLTLVPRGLEPSGIRLVTIHH